VSGHVSVTTATAPDALAAAARMLVDFNAEYGDPAPDAEWLAGHLAELIRAGDTSVLLVGGAPGGGISAPDDGPARPGSAVGVAVLRFRTSVWAAETEAYLAEFYVQPAWRSRGIGTTFLDDVIEHARSRGATYLDLNTSEDDEAARHVYEKRGFDCHEGRGSGPRAIYYELELD
jgi:ribosomal protein S18 acetylase RimI-like enzyme